MTEFADDRTILNMLSAAIIIIIIISIFLAIKDFIPNAFSGLFIYRNKFLMEGDARNIKSQYPCAIREVPVVANVDSNFGEFCLKNWVA